MKIAHISDLHLSKITFNPMQFFSKRWVGNGNLILSRHKTYTEKPLFKLPSLFSDLGVELLVITGDLSTTSREEEFIYVKDLLAKIKIKTLLVPGNHDHYTKTSYRDKTFYSFFQNPPALFGTSLKDHGLEVGKLFSNWYYICLDTAIATNIFSSRGLFSKELENQLINILDKIPDHASIMLITHYPLFQNDSSRKKLLRADKLQELTKNQKIKLYLHGHTHRHCIADLRPSNYPILLESGSTSHKKMGSFNLLNLKETTLEIDTYNWIENNRWVKKSKVSFKGL